MEKHLNFALSLKSQKTLLIALILILTSTPVFAAGDKAAGKSKAIHCQVCHGKNGLSFNPLYPVLAGQHKEYIIKQLKDFKAKRRPNPIMNQIAAPLTEQDMEDLAAFFNAGRDHINFLKPEN